MEATVEKGRTRWVFRRGSVTIPADDNRPVGSRLWLYTNFDCNLRCDYCCVRSSPNAPRRELGLARVQRIAHEAAKLGVNEIFVTGGEPFLLEDIDEILSACAAAAPTTVLTNGMLFSGRRAESLRALPRDRIVLQISLDSATPKLHDLHRGTGTWARTREGIQRLVRRGFACDWQRPFRLRPRPRSSANSSMRRRFRPKTESSVGSPYVRCRQRRSRRHSARSATGSHDHRGGCVLASGWRGRCRPPGYPRYFPLSESFAASAVPSIAKANTRNKLAKIFNCA